MKHFPDFHLPPRAKRQWLSEDFDAQSASHIEALLADLMGHIPHDFPSARQWYGLFQEASAAIYEAQSLLELNWQLDMTSQAAEKQLRQFEKNVLSQVLSSRGTLIQIYLDSPWRMAMHADDGGRLAHESLHRKKTAHPKVAELQLQENQIVREYRTFTNSAQCSFLGRLTPLSAVVGRLNDRSGEIRKAAFFSYWGFVKSNEKKYQQLFDRLLDVRTAQARILGEESYVNLAFAELGRIDHSASHCAQLRASILSHVVPQVQSLLPHQLKSLGAAQLKPWDVGICPAFQPDEDPATGSLHMLLDGLERIAGRVHPSFARFASDLQKRKLIEIFPRHGKAAGAFCVPLHERRTPVIFGNFSGSPKDGFTLLHEFGHALHSWASAQIDNVMLRLPGYEFCEVASMGFEALALPHLGEWYKPRDASKAAAGHLFSALHFWPFVAMYDGFQHAIYGNSHASLMTHPERNALWSQMAREYRPHIDWSDCPEFEGLGWLSRPHIFTSPFYYIDYGIAQIGAMHLWNQSSTHPQAAVQNYISALALGGQRSLPQLFDVLGVPLDFGSQTIGNLTQSMVAHVKGAFAQHTNHHVF